VAGVAAPPGIIIPKASAQEAIVIAEPITIQCPGVGASCLLISCISVSSTVPALYSCQKYRQSEQAPNVLPLYSPLFIGPPENKTAGLSALAAPINWAGAILSHPLIITAPSIGCAAIISSVSIAAKLRYNMVVGLVNISPSEMVGNSNGVPPSIVIPCFIAATIG